MNALIVTKPTNLEQHGQVVRAQIKRGKLTQASLEELETAHEEHYQSLARVREVLEAKQINFEEISRGDRWPSKNDLDMVVSVGGDGTLLSASHRILTEVPVIGVRSSNSSIGYLCACGYDGIEETIQKYLDGTIKLASCSRLRAIISYAEEGRERQTVPVLNDFLFANHNPSATTRYNIKLGTVTEAHKSSGVWVSTATGSTAGILAAGGQKMDREDQKFQYRVRELYAAQETLYKLTSGFFDPEDNLILENRNEAAVLALDGQRGVIPLKFGDTITFERAAPIKIAMAN